MHPQQTECLKKGDGLDWSNLGGIIEARNENAEKLRIRYERCFLSPSKKGSELVTITGQPGVGKTRLALTLSKKASADNGFLIVGKFDQLERNHHCATTQVFATFTEAFTQYIEGVVEAGETSIQSVKGALLAKMASAELQVLQEMIPALKKIVDLTTPKRPSAQGTPTLKGADAEGRLIQILTRFVRTICSQGYPIVLVLDDVQWANQTALNLLTSLLVINDTSVVAPLMVMCTCRTNEVGDDHPYKSALRDLAKHHVMMTDVEVCNLSEQEVDSIVSTLLLVPDTVSRPLSNLLFERTEGNLLFLIELLKSLHERRLISRQEVGQWTWDMKEITDAAGLDTINVLIVEKFHLLHDTERKLLKIAACIGSSFSTTLLSYTDKVAADEVDAVVQNLEAGGFIRVDQKSGHCRFVHDKVQQAIYQLTPESETDELHLSIGREMRKSMTREQLAENVLLVSHQLSLGIHLVDDADEKKEIAELFFQAAQKAALSSSFLTAAAFLHLAINLLSRRHWRDNYRLSLQIYNMAAEMEYYNGNLQRVDELVESVINHSVSFDDTLVARFTRIYSLGSRGRMLEALHESLGVLKSLGENFPRKPTIVNIVIGLLRCKSMLHGKTDKDILSLPTLKDKKKQAALKLMHMNNVFAFYESAEHVPLFAFRMVQTTLRHGLSGTLMGMIYAIQGNIDEAYRFSKLSLKIFDKFDAKEWQARVGILVYGFVYPLKHAFRDALEPLHAAHRNSLVMGDIHMSLICYGCFGTLSYFAGHQLSHFIKDVKHCRDLCIKYGQHSVGSSMDIELQFALNLMGQAPNPLVLTGEACDEDEALLAAKESNPVNFVSLHSLKLQLAVYMNDITAARLIVQKLKKMDKTKGDRKRAKQSLAKLEIFAKHAPSNFLSKVYLIEAELAAQANQRDDALANYQLSIQLAQREGLIHEQALACEHAAYTFQRWHQLPGAREYLIEARRLYEHWGSQIKVEKLDALLLDLSASG